MVSRLAQQRQRSPALNVALVFVGALALLVDGTLAVWGATIVGLAGLVRGDDWSRVGMSAATLALSQSAAAFAHEVTDQVIPDQLSLGLTQTGAIAGTPFGVVSALVVGLTLALSWQALRWVTSWLDRRAPAGTRRSRTEARWLVDLSIAGMAVMVAVAWAAYAPLVLLLIVPLLTVWRLVATPARGLATAGVVDDLTGVGTAGLLRAALSEELVRAEQFDRAVAVLIVRLDGHEGMQDRLGPGAAEDATRAVGRAATEVARDYDIVARISDDTFALVLPEAPRGGAHGVGQRICRLLAESPVTTGAGEVAVTASIGVAVYPGDARTREGLLTEAELAAEYASLEGGDRVQDAATLPAGFRSSPGRRSDPADLAPTTEPLGPDRLVRATFEPLAAARPGTDQLLLVVLGVTLFAAVASTLAAPAPFPLTVTLLFVLLAVGAEGVAGSVYGRVSASVAAVPLIALAVYPDTSALAVLVACVGAGTLGGLIRGVRTRQAVFNSAVLYLATFVAWLLARPILEVQGGGILGAAAIGIVAGSAFAAVDTALVAAAVAVSEDRRVFAVWRDDLLWLVPHQLGLGVLGGALAFAQAELGTGGTLVLAIPAVALHVAQQQFLARSRDHIVELRNANDDMLDANRRIAKVSERLTDALEQVNSGYLVTVESLAAAVDARDAYAGSHTERIEAYSRQLLAIVDPNLADDEALLWGFRLHDVGKIGVPDRILTKPGPLDDDEWAAMRRHPEVGAQLVAAAPFLQGARDVILHHHERWDGRGYPYGLSAEAIPFSARLFTVIDAYDAMTTDRPYRDALPIDRALRELVRHAGSQFDPEVVEAFLQIPVDDLAAIRTQAAEARAEARSSRTGTSLIRISSYADVEGLVPHVTGTSRGRGPRR